MDSPITSISLDSDPIPYSVIAEIESERKWNVPFPKRKL